MADIVKRDNDWITIRCRVCKVETPKFAPRGDKFWCPACGKSDKYPYIPEQYECKRCKKRHKYERHAWECCSSYEPTIWVCDYCGKEYDNDDDAQFCECLKPITLPLCPGCGEPDPEGTCCPEYPKAIPLLTGQVSLFGEEEDSH